MASKDAENSSNGTAASSVSSSVEELLLAALERGNESLETGRYVATFKQDRVNQGLQFLAAQGLRVANTGDFKGQAATLEEVGDADAVVFLEIGVALLGGEAAQQSDMSVQAQIAADGPIASFGPENFKFVEDTSGEYPRGVVQAAKDNPTEYLHGFLAATETITRDLRDSRQSQLEDDEVQVLGATWGLVKCKVPSSAHTGTGITVAVLDTGMDLGHLDFCQPPLRMTM